MQVKSSQVGILLSRAILEVRACTRERGKPVHRIPGSNQPRRRLRAP